MAILEYDVFAPTPTLDFWMPDMQPLRKRVFSKACATKRAYRSKAAANHHRIHINATNQEHPTLLPYHCEVCGRWHLRTVIKIKS